MDWKIILDIVFFALTVAIAIYAILDVREQARKLIELERKAAWAEVANEMVWLFVDPTVEIHSKNCRRH